jgi:hypothetical protein
MVLALNALSDFWLIQMNARVSPQMAVGLSKLITPGPTMQKLEKLCLAATG